jgi:sulfur carrier protein
MKIVIERPRKDLDLEFEGSVEDLLSKLNVNPEEVVVSRNGELVTFDEILKNEDNIVIMSVVSGG